MIQKPPQCENLPEQVEKILELLLPEPSWRSQDVSAVQESLKKAIAPKFEIVSAEGHATGTQCYIEYAEPDAERVVLTFSSAAEIQTEAVALSQRLGMSSATKIDQSEIVDLLRQGCEAIILKEGGESKSELAKEARALMLLLSGYEQNRDRIHPSNNATGGKASPTVC